MKVVEGLNWTGSGATWSGRSDSSLRVAVNASDLTWSLRHVAPSDRKHERPHVVAARRRSESDSRALETENASDLAESL
ncbi:hypothetical protein F2Q69_00059880 [Brassica cretica]|uniref:Uncharacterized protein n=1 Tax=Brassica cretica TaxID=69181 RepID=A0A8S9RD01_BRACR|nr:hypothetical protein F2Q69_00059880 [Brassica cretica]